MQGKNTQQKAWRQTYIVDRKQLDSFSKDIPKMFPFSTTVPIWSQKISKLLSQSDQSEVKIAKQQRLTFQKLSDITADISSLRQILKYYDQTNQYLVKVQSSSENTLGKLQQFRNKMGISYEQLADQQEKLNDELEMLNKKIQNMDRDEDTYEQKENIKTGNKEVKIWDKKDLQKINKSAQKGQSEDNQLTLIEGRMKETQRQVQAIQKAISGLGKNLGWPEQDHNDFLTIWNKGPSHKNYFQIEQELKTYFAFYTGEQIQQHMNKYMKWKKLSEEKKELIVLYKNLKEERKMEELKMLNLERQHSKERREKQQQRRRQQKQQYQMKNKIGEWKQAKNRERRQEQERRQREQFQKKQIQAIKRRQTEQRKRQLLQRWKQEEAERKSQQVSRVKSARKPTKADKQAEQRIRARQQLLIQKKIELFNEKRQEEEMLRQKQQRLKEEKFIKYAHVNNKLQHKTTAMKQKQREKFDGKDKKDANTFGGQLLMAGRATPAWMKGI